MEIQRLKEIPAPLREIPQPPKQLYIVGDLPPLDTHTYIAFVGSRRNTGYGKQVCQDMIAALAGTNAVVVSGLALGTDAIAHNAALANKVPTLAVPGSGLDERVLYPRSNLQLAREIIQKGGALLSEYEPTFRATAYSFPRRNRIMAGLCRFVFIIEAGERSGTLITARLATEYNRTVFTVPHSIYSPTSVGPSMLLRLGATPITSTAIFLEELGIVKKTIHERIDMSETEKLLCNHLFEPRSKDELVLLTNLSINEIASTLMIMELKGLVTERLGKFYLCS